MMRLQIPTRIFVDKSIASSRIGTYYSSMDKEDATRRDKLARVRTHLANERTFLAYVRTAASFVVVGAAFINFLEDVGSKILGVVTVMIGLAILGIGVWRFRGRSTHIRSH